MGSGVCYVLKNQRLSVFTHNEQINLYSKKKLSPFGVGFKQSITPLHLLTPLPSRAKENPKFYLFA